ncbi:MAG: hypothetical protein AAGE01_07040 [Pseudomonadota bacterium]
MKPLRPFRFLLLLLLSLPGAGNAIDPGVGGAWIDPGHSGQGILFEVVPTDRQLVAYWFTWAADGSRLWRVGQGAYDDGDASLTFVEADDGLYLDPAPVTLRPVGEATVRFDDCRSARMVYADADGEERILELARLAPDTRCHLGEREGPSEYVVDARGRAVALNGLWRAEGCVRIGTSRSLSRETMTFAGDTLEIRMTQHASTDCSGPVESVNVSLLLRAAGRSVANLDGRDVPVTRFDVIDVASGESQRQVFYLELLEDRMRLTHGVFGDEGGRVDADGYPLDLFTVFLERAR